MTKKSLRVVSLPERQREAKRARAASDPQQFVGRYAPLWLDHGRVLKLHYHLEPPKEVQVAYQTCNKCEAHSLPCKRKRPKEGVKKKTKKKKKKREGTAGAGVREQEEGREKKMFSTHGTDEEHVVQDTYAEDEERRRQLRVSMLEGLSLGDEEGGRGEGDDENESERTKAKEEKNENDAAPNTAAAVLFNKRKKQALRNTFGFISPGDIPTADDEDDTTALEAPMKLRVSMDVPTKSGSSDKGSAPRATQEKEQPASTAQPTAVSPLVPQRAQPPSPLRGQPAPPPRTIRQAPASPSPLARNQAPTPSSVPVAAEPALASPPQSASPASGTFPTRPLAGSAPLSNTGSTLRQGVPAGAAGRGALPPAPFRPSGGAGRGALPPPSELQPPSSSSSILAPALPLPSAPTSSSDPPAVGRGLSFARPPPPNGVGRPSATSTMRTGVPPPTASRAPTVPVHATIRTPPPTAPRGGTGTSPASTSLVSSILSPRLGSSGSGITVAQREVDEFKETISKKGTIDVHCSIEKKDKYTVGSEVSIKIRIVNDSDKVIRHVSASLAKNTERSAWDKRRDTNKNLPKFDGTEEMMSFANKRFPLEKGLFDGVFNYKIPPCKEGSYSFFKVDLVIELAFKKSSIYAFLPINL